MKGGGGVGGGWNGNLSMHVSRLLTNGSRLESEHAILTVRFCDDIVFYFTVTMFIPHGQFTTIECVFMLVRARVTLTKCLLRFARTNNSFHPSCH